MEKNTEVKEKPKMKEILDSFTELENVILHRLVLYTIKKNAGEYISKDEKAVNEYLKYLVEAYFDEKKQHAALYLLDYVKKLPFEKESKKKEEMN